MSGRAILCGILLAAGCAGDATAPGEQRQALEATGAVRSFAAHRFGGGLPDHLALDAAFWDATFIYPWEPEGTQVCSSDDRMAIAGAWIGLTKKEEGITAGDVQREIVAAPEFTFRLLGADGFSLDVPTFFHPSAAGASFEVVIDTTLDEVVGSCDEAYLFFDYGVRGQGDKCFARTSVGWVPAGLPPGVYGLATVDETGVYVDSFLDIQDCLTGGGR